MTDTDSCPLCHAGGYSDRDDDGEEEFILVPRRNVSDRLWEVLVGCWGAKVVQGTFQG